MNKHGEKASTPACPKPRKPDYAEPEFLHPLSCKHSQAGRQGTCQALDTVLRKNVDARREIVSSNSTGCPPCCYCGSPPARVGNPLVHDVQFVHQVEMLSPWTRTKLSNRYDMHSA